MPWDIINDWSNGAVEDSMLLRGELELQPGSEVRLSPPEFLTACEFRIVPTDEVENTSLRSGTSEGAVEALVEWSDSAVPDKTRVSDHEIRTLRASDRYFPKWIGFRGCDGLVVVEFEVYVRRGP